MRVNFKYFPQADWKDRLFGIRCPWCNQRVKDMRNDTYTRGYNELCSQASGDDGFYCTECQRITYLISYEESRRITPTWCTVRPDTARAKWFPDFKFNKDVSKIPTHHSHTVSPLPEATPVTPPARNSFGWWPQHSRLIQ